LRGKRGQEQASNRALKNRQLFEKYFWGGERKTDRGLARKKRILRTDNGYSNGYDDSYDD